MQLLLQRGANASTSVPPYDVNLLCYSVRMYNVKAVELLLAFSPSLELSRQKYGRWVNHRRTPLAIAIMRDNLEAAELLLKAAADPNNRIDDAAPAGSLQYAAVKTDKGC
ncbi:uncharacterized protein BDV17DRAFT_289941 [Aspergillus undulatus]|uniref:uncharacterized protein n=1 Tax=Aspergillus undulatus TaxID=1810928 RepID=UPI003CCCAC6C